MLKKKNYRLEIVVQLREKAKSEALSFVDICRQKMEQAKEHLRMCEENVERCLSQQNTNSETLKTEFDKSLQTNRLLQFKNYGYELKRRESELREAVLDQEKVVEKTIVELEIALKNLVLATKELKAIEKHKEKWVEQKRNEAVKTEQKLNDEIGMILFQRNKLEKLNRK